MDKNKAISGYEKIFDDAIGLAARRNRASSFIENGKVYYGCYGYTDTMTDEPLPECKRCELWERKYW